MDSFTAFYMKYFGLKYAILAVAIVGAIALVEVAVANYRKKGRMTNRIRSTREQVALHRSFNRWKEANNG